ncbi:tRNA lysidine(34) synthetase TilS [Wukongibacter baidiensis]|uniref:tRNA lysidine(34) synthetase TilS n=1 Tax=Wukongibacter baidiensis TaxID=1723361 RepID=UPI003D7FEC8E
MGIIEKVLKTIKNHKLIEKNEGVVVGVSGGPDSICLLHLLWRLCEELSLKIFVVHLDHQFRGIEAKKDAEYVEEICEKIGVKSYIFSYDVNKYSKEKGITFEEAGRELRYKLFDKVAKETGATKIAVAQNRNDQAETVLMRLMRGSGLEGLTAIGYKRDGKIIRPLLDITRQEIEDYCEENNLKPRIDKTNLETIYTRNKIRLELIPYIENNFNSRVIDALWRSSNLLRDDSDYLAKAAAKELKNITISNNSNNYSLDLEKFGMLHISMKRRVLRRVIDEVKGNLKDISLKHIEGIIKLTNRNNVGSKIDLPGHIIVELGYNSIDVKTEKFIKEKIKNRDFEYKLYMDETTPLEALNASMKVEIVSSSDRHNSTEGRNTIFLDYDKVKGGLFIRNRKDGDKFQPLGMKGTKKIKDYFIDQKIPKEIRNEIPILCDEKGIIWIVGYRMSENYKIDIKTDKVIKITYMKVV